MKVRWKYDSLRLRITPTELKNLLDGRQIFERFDLSEEPVWEVILCPNAKETSLRNTGSVVRLMLSQQDQIKLMSPDIPGVYFTTNRPDGSSLRYFIEKDFPCVHARPLDSQESPTETFPSPNIINQP
jgi:hypothetical protein